MVIQISQLITVDTDIKIAYPLTLSKVRGISNEKKNKKDFGGHNDYSSPANRRGIELTPMNCQYQEMVF